MAILPKLILKKGKEKALRQGHPWVFSGAVERIDGEISPGQIGEIFTKEGQFLGIGHVNPLSQIIFRCLTQRREDLNEKFFRNRILRASQIREERCKKRTNSYRLINGEGDFLPGLIVDRYGDILVLQCLTAGMDQIKGTLTHILAKEFQPKSIFERSDVAIRREEGLPESQGLLYGKEVPESIEIEEYGCRYKVNVKKGQKTGFYLDQRENRFLLRDYSKGKKILDGFCYTGAFSIHAGVGGAKEITLIDSSEESLNIVDHHFGLNRLEKIPHQVIRGDVFEVLRNIEPGYDVVILDPPPFAKKRGHLQSASRGYKEINLWAFRLLNERGWLFTFSCSHHIELNLFQKIIFSAALDSGRKVQLIGRLGHSWDHPVNLYHPEGEYLKGLICRVE